MTKSNKTLFAVAFFNLAFGLGAACLSSLPTPAYLIGAAQGLAMSTLGLLLLVWWLAGKHRDERLRLEERLQHAVDCLRDRPVYGPAPEPAPTRYGSFLDTSATYLGQLVEVRTFYDEHNRVVDWHIEVDGKELADFPEWGMGRVNHDDGYLELRDVWYAGTAWMGTEGGPRDVYVDEAVWVTEQSVDLNKLKPYLELRAKYLEEFSMAKFPGVLGKRGFRSSSPLTKSVPSSSEPSAS